MQIPPALSPRRAALLIATLALLVSAALVLSSASGAGARPVAHLALVDRNPATVSGHGFRPGVRVHLVLIDHGVMTRRPLANATGRFTVSFPTSVDRCTGWSVTATQPGRRLVTLGAKTECPPL